MRGQRRRRGVGRSRPVNQGLDVTPGTAVRVAIAVDVILGVGVSVSVALQMSRCRCDRELLEESRGHAGRTEAG